MPKRFYEKDGDLSYALKGKKTVAIIGATAPRGHAHALNLRDSGLPDVVVGLNKDSKSCAESAGRRPQSPHTVADAAKAAEAVMMVPGARPTFQAEIYNQDIAPHP